MALFKIFKGTSENGKINTKKPITHEGYCYFDEFDQKFYIDVADGNAEDAQGNPTGNRKVIRTDLSDYAIRAQNDIYGNALMNYRFTVNENGVLIISSLDGAD